jgi:hypothetical protein
MAPQERRAAVQEETVELLDPQRASEAFRNRARERGQLRRLTNEAQTRGYRTREEPEEFVGVRFRARASRDVEPTGPTGGAAVGEAVRTVEVEVVGHSISKGDAEGAVATATIRAGGNELTYDLLLEAPGGRFQEAREFTIVNDRVVPANSWWSAWTGCLQRSCISTCLTSLVVCSGTWAAYFWCVAAACGGCVLKCSACATCDCSWWCRWAAGCCDA